MTKMTKSERAERKRFVERRRKAHHKALEGLSTVSSADDGLRIWRKLLVAERRAHAWAETRCEFSMSDHQVETVVKQAAKHVADALGSLPRGFFFNWDPRGHSLKIDCDSANIPEGMVRDMGGDGILAPLID